MLPGNALTVKNIISLALKPKLNGVGPVKTGVGMPDFV